MWSNGYHVTEAELRELHSAMDRRDGLFYLAAAAGFVIDHQGPGDRLDFGNLFTAYRDQFPFLVGGSNEDPFEHRQVDLAEERLGKLALRIERLPGGHLTTNERPDALATLIANFERGLSKMPSWRSQNALEHQSMDFSRRTAMTDTTVKVIAVPDILAGSADRPTR